MDPIKIGKNLYRIRLYYGLNRKEAAAQMGIHFNSLLRLEHGRGFPRLDTMIILADYYGVSVQKLFLEEKIMIQPRSRKSKTKNS